jgi:hypothetical protein
MTTALAHDASSPAHLRTPAKEQGYNHQNPLRTESPAAAAAPRYTRLVYWKRLVSLIALAVLTMQPASSVVCSLLCESTTASTPTASVHHHDGSTERTRSQSIADPFAGARVRVPEHGCGSHDAALRPASTTVAERADKSATQTAPAMAATPATFITWSEPGPRVQYRTPPGASPPTATPLVLRV